MMKNILPILILSIFFLSCQNKADEEKNGNVVLNTLSISKNADDIKLNSLTNVCDYIEALDIVMTEMVELNDKYPDEIKFIIGPVADGDVVIHNEHTERFEVLQDRFEEIGQAAYKKYTIAEFKECSNYKAFSERSARLRTKN
jgi:thioredoxin-related protein